ncbi:MAG TPA: hypothetical protein VIJ57_07060 [Hanamia sp.]
MKKLLLLICCFSALHSFAQKDSLQNQILNYSDSNVEIITKGRGLLAEKFMEGDYEKVREIRDYLLQKVQDKNYLIFYPLENWYILYWTQQYNELLKSISVTDSLNNQRFNRIGYDDDLRFDKKIQPAQDLLFSKLYERSKDSILQLDTFIDNSSLKDEDKDFLKLNLLYLIKAGSSRATARDSLNVSADKFLEEFPASKHVSFIRKYIRAEYVPSKWGFVFEFFSGYDILTKELKDHFTNAVPIGVAFDIYYKKWALFLRDHIGLNKTSIDIPYNNGVWEKGSQVRVYLPEASVGYVALENKILKLTPFAGISSTDFSPTTVDQNSNSNLKNAELKFTTTWSAGLNVDIKIGRSKTPMVSYNEESYWFLRVRYGYNLPQFQNKYDGYSGAIHYITVGVGGFGRAIKRKY